jgi:hypothetical protein
LVQQQYFLEVATKVVLPQFQQSGRPFVLVYWSRDPDGTQHNQGDSLGRLDPGINGPTSRAAVRSADIALSLLEAALEQLGLAATTNIVVAADHGFSTIRKEGSNSHAAQEHYPDVSAGELPLGFLAIDLSADLLQRHPRWKLFDPDDDYREIRWHAGEHPVRGNGLIGEDPDHPQVVVAANGGSDLIYLPDQPPLRRAHPGRPAVAARAPRAQRQLAAELLNALLAHDYVSGVFLDEQRFGELPGALSTRAIDIGGGAAITPAPAIVVNFASSIVGSCTRAATLCTAEFADTNLQQGQGMHGTFSRADTWNFMAARGPDFRHGFVDPLPASNADIGMTIAHLLNVDVSRKGPLTGRFLSEALASDAPVEALPPVTTRSLASRPGPGGLRTILRTQSVGATVYFDAAGFPGRTVGLGAE